MAVKLAFEADGEGPALLLLHGVFGFSRNWRQVAQLLMSDFRVLRVDLRNHGSSPHAMSMRYSEMAEDVATLIDAECGGRAHVLGHSMGGKVAMTLALRSPSQVAKLIVADIAPKAYRDRFFSSYVRAMRGLTSTDLQSRNSADTALERHIPDAAIRQFLLMNLRRGEHGYQWQLNLEVIGNSMPILSDFPALEGPFDGPTLFLRGARSDYIRDTDQARIQHLFPNASFTTIEDAGHWLHAEKPKAVARSVAAFLVG